MKTPSLMKNRRALRQVIAVISVGLIGMALAAVLAAIIPRTFEASATVYVTSVTRTGTGGAQRQSLVETQDAQQKVLTLANLATSDVVAERVINTLGLPMTTTDLREVLDAQAVPETVLIEISARDESPVRAREIANTTALEFSDYVNQLNEETPNAASDTTVRLVDPALTPTVSSSPSTATMMALGLVAGLGIGILLVSLVRRADQRIDDGSLLETVTDLPHLGSTPLARVGRKGLSAVSEDPAASERFRAIRTNLIQILPDLTGRLLAVVSAQDSAGKTELTVGLAQAFQQAGYSVLILDGDLRNRDLTTRLGLVDRPGLVDRLAYNVPLERVIQAGALGKVDVIGVGRDTTQPSEILGSEAFGRTIEELRARYHLVLINTPRISGFTDGAVIARHTDGTVLVVPYHEENPQQVSSSIDAIAKAGGKVIGTVITLAPDEDQS